MRLLCEICRAGEADPQQTYEVMNEVVVDRGANPYLTKIECWEHDRLITKVQMCWPCPCLHSGAALHVAAPPYPGLRLVH